VTQEVVVNMGDLFDAEDPVVFSVEWSEIKDWWSKNDRLKEEEDVKQYRVPWWKEYGSPQIDFRVFDFSEDKCILLVWPNGAAPGSGEPCFERLHLCSSFALVRIQCKEYLGLRVGALGKMAVESGWRRNGFANTLLEIACMYMQLNGFDVSVLWASVLELYRNFGWLSLKDDCNMMVKYFKPCSVPASELLKIPQVIGTW